jgi:hypothetical protein
MTYALGRGLAASDMPAVRRVLRDAAAREYRVSAIIDGIVASEPFRMRVKGALAAPPTAPRAAE